jgi:hypothetical protein
LEYVDLAGTGFVIAKLPDEIIEECNNITKSILDNPDNFEAYNAGLAGHIKKEYKCNPPKGFEEFVQSMMEMHFNSSPYLSTLTVCDNDLPIMLENFWVNFQEKYEYNPPHHHSGVFSFVIWHKVPYTKEDEEKVFENTSIGCWNGNFSFIYNDALGIQNYIIPADNKMEGYICLFPANLIHAVYPFFTSDEYRISMSGNFKLTTK